LDLGCGTGTIYLAAHDNGGRVVNVGPILSKYGSMINREGLWLHGYVADEQRKFFQNGGFTPLDSPVIKQADGRDGA
jgi:hypothetical protein